MVRLIATAGLLALAGLTAAHAEDKKAAAPSGTWVRENSGHELTFAFAKDSLTLKVIRDVNGADVTAKYAVADGVVKATVTKVDEIGTFPGKPPVGFEFAFKWAAKGDAATLADLAAPGFEEVKAIVEGEYARKKAK